MLCIIAFVLFLIFFPFLGFFPGYRRFFRKSWSCVVKKATFKPCDINLGEEIKGKLLSKMVFRFPRFTKFIDKTFSFWALAFVVFNIWTLLTVFLAGLNLFVYDTCEPTTGDGCALSGDSCEIGIESITFREAYQERKLWDWAKQPFEQFANTVSLIPSRLKSWNAEDYLGPKPTYYKFTEDNPTALEIIDPGCPSCAQLWQNIKEANFTDNYNLSYLIYPIPSQSNSWGYRFSNSYFLARYIEATKYVPLEDSEIPGDWLLLDKVFTGQNEKGSNQDIFSYFHSPEDEGATELVNTLLSEIGYSQEQIQEIAEYVDSQEVKDSIQKQTEIVEDDIVTIKIPTIIFDGKRQDRVVDVEDLK